MAGARARRSIASAPTKSPRAALHEALEARLERRGGVVELVTVERQRGFEAQRVARAESARAQAQRPARVEQRARRRAPTSRAVARRARSRRSPCSRCARPAPCAPATLPSAKRKRFSEPVGSGAEPREDRGARGTLEREQPVASLRSSTRASAPGVAHDPAVVLLDVRGVHAQEEARPRRAGRRSRRRRRRRSRCRAGRSARGPARSEATGQVTSRSTLATAPGPARWISPMCETSKRPAALAHGGVLLEDRACTAPASRSRRTAPCARRARGAPRRAACA